MNNPSPSASDDTSPRKHASIYDLFMLCVCIYVLFTLAAMTFLELDPDILTILNYVDVVVCVFFLVDFLVRFTTAKSKVNYMTRELGFIDLISSVPLLGYLRWGRLSRLVRILRLLQGVKSSKVIIEHALNRRAESTFAAAVLIAFIVIIYASITVLYFERGAEGAKIATPEDALWWAVTTITTVGYGDFYPVTGGGRIVGVAVMTAGVALFGALTGFVAVWFLQPTQAREKSELQAARRQLAEIEKHMAILTSEQERLRAKEKDGD